MSPARKPKRGSAAVNGTPVVTTVEADALTEAALRYDPTPDREIGEIGMMDRLLDGRVRIRQKMNTGTLVTTYGATVKECREAHRKLLAERAAALGDSAGPVEY
jgi:hypothetical protein